MKFVFADTGYWIALLDKKDQLHSRAIALAPQLENVHIFTSNLVLIETLTFFSSSGPIARKQAHQLLVSIENNPQVTVVHLSPTLYQSMLLMYGAMSDKQWSPADCASFVIMKNKKIKEALAYDKHFEQAGFAALLRQIPHELG